MLATIPAEKIYDAREIPCSIKHGQILSRAQALALEDFFVLINGHNPVPLKYQLNAEHPGQFSWDYLQEGPDAFAVRIGRIKQAV
jgi:uncharacterized protein (DUF2249 family)